MTFYQQIKHLQHPFDDGDDSVAYSQVAFNVLCVKEFSNTFLEELVKILVLKSVGVLNVNLFASTQPQLPELSSSLPSFLHVASTGGLSGVGKHNAVLGMVRPSAKITARAEDYVTANALACRAFEALVEVRNLEVVP